MNYDNIEIIKTISKSKLNEIYDNYVHPPKDETVPKFKIEIKDISLEKEIETYIIIKPFVKSIKLGFREYIDMYDLQVQLEINGYRIQNIKNLLPLITIISPIIDENDIIWINITDDLLFPNGLPQSPFIQFNLDITSKKNIQLKLNIENYLTCKTILVDWIPIKIIQQYNDIYLIKSHVSSLILYTDDYSNSIDTLSLNINGLNICDTWDPSLIKSKIHSNNSPSQFIINYNPSEINEQVNILYEETKLPNDIINYIIKPMLLPDVLVTFYLLPFNNLININMLLDPQLIYTFKDNQNKSLNILALSEDFIHSIYGILSI